MRVYHDAAGAISFTAFGDMGPDGDYIVIPDQDLGDLLDWRVVDGQLVEAEGIEDRRLQAAREAAWLSKVDFFNRVRQAGILTPEESLLGAKGEIAPRLQAYIDLLDPEQQIDLEVTFAAATHFERLDPYLLLFAWMMDISDRAADALFGIEVPE